MSKDIGFFQGLAEQRHKVALELLDDISLLTQQRDELLDACKEAKRDFYYIHQHPEDAHVNSYNFMEKVKAAIAKVT